jgi:hypothetical protein
MQSFFASRLNGTDGTALLAYDSTIVSTYSGQIPKARYGFNKAHDGLETVKFLSLYSIDTRQPATFTKQPGNQPDVITIEKRPEAAAGTWHHPDRNCHGQWLLFRKEPC